MLAQEIIRKKREALPLDKEEINYFIKGMLDQSITEGQVAALAMAIYFQGMQQQECAALTQALQGSGTTLQWQHMALDGPVVDKHSTGGVGDKVSLMLAPMLAACGAYVPMISGRGLGHSGGTLDKMDSIPGYSTSPDVEHFQQVVKQVGCAIVGQTADLAPADKRLYGIRDVTATVESIPLITASILSKKLSAGLDSLVMDVKTGSGAFAGSLSQAQQLTASLVEVGQGLELPIVALITDMSQVLGLTAGNAVEVQESVDYLTGHYREPRLHEVTLELGAELLVACKAAENIDQARLKLEQALQSGQAAEYFARMVKALGGPADFIERPGHYLPVAAYSEAVYAVQTGVVTAIDVRAVGNTVVELGGGRRRPQDPVEHSVGLTAVKALGEAVSDSEPLAMVHAQNKEAAQQAARQLQQAFSVGESAAQPTPVIYERMGNQ